MKQKPTVQLTGQDGNVFNIIGLCRRSARAAGWSKEEIDALIERLHRSGSYDRVLQLIMQEFDVS